MHITKSQVKYINSLLQKKNRNKDGRFVIEGYKLIKEALAANVSFEYVVYHKNILKKPQYKDMMEDLKKVGAEIFWAFDQELDKLGNFDTSDGLIAVVNKLDSQTKIGDPEIILALDAINDPGNLGTILRTASWFGVDTVLVGEGSVDLYNPKVLRGSMGAAFSLNISQDVDLVTELKNLQKSGYKAYGASLQGKVSLQKVFTKSKKTVIALGSESHGLSDKIESACDDLFKIKGFGNAESLNVGVSAGIVLYEITK